MSGCRSGSALRTSDQEIECVGKDALFKAGSRMSKKLQLVVLGIIGRDPLAGVAWQALHYLEGFRRLGHDVYYVEDTGVWADNCSDTVSYIGRLMDWCDLPDRWAYCAASLGGRCFGLSEYQLSRLFEKADALINVTASTLLRDEHLMVPVRVYLETDPGLPQIAVAKGNRKAIDLLNAHTHHFTYGENFGEPDCGLPVGPFNHCPTRQPIVVDWWSSTSDRATNKSFQATVQSRFTTVATWKESAKDIEWNGETYTWSKHHQFLKFIDLPRSTAQLLELALACGNLDTVRLLESHGWRIVDAIALSHDILPYRAYIVGSRGEFTVAKDQYTRLHTGWFSDRSACYLAAGRPVITQETGFSKFLPTGKGLFGFKTMEDILMAIDMIASDYKGNCLAARGIAIEYFAADNVLGSLIDRAGL